MVWCNITYSICLRCKTPSLSCLGMSVFEYQTSITRSVKANEMLTSHVTSPRMTSVYPLDFMHICGWRVKLLLRRGIRFKQAISRHPRRLLANPTSSTVPSDRLRQLHICYARRNSVLTNLLCKAEPSESVGILVCASIDCDYNCVGVPGDSGGCSCDCVRCAKLIADNFLSCHPWSISDSWETPKKSLW